MNYPRFPIFLFSDTSADTGGAGPAPAAPGSDGAPVSPIPDSPPDSGSESHDSFAGMEDNDFDAIEIPAEPTGGEPGAEAQPQPSPVAKPAATPAPAAAQPQQPSPQAAAPAQNVPPSAPRSPLDQAIDGFRTNHSALSDWASKELFALTPEDAEKMETDAASHIPVLMGRVYSQALQATVNLIKNFVPEMVNSGVATTTARAARATEALQEFYAANQHLNPQQHGALVDKWARSFRAANPQASRADAIKFVGRAVTTELGINPAPNGRQGRPAPFAPARPGTRVQQPAPQNDPYEGMDQDYDDN